MSTTRRVSLTLESLSIAIAATLLTMSGVPATSTGDRLYLVDLQRTVVVQMGLLDWVSFLLLDFFYIFAVWTYVTVKGGQLGMRAYLSLAALALPAIFLGNAVKVFAQVFALASSEALSGGTDAASIASADAVGFGVMFGIVSAAITVTCVFLSRWSTGRPGWPLASNGLGKIH